MYDAEVLLSIKKDALDRYPEESCGLILRKADGSTLYKSMPNVASDPLNSFHIDERSILSVKAALVAIVHSHPDGPDCPSETDMRSQLLYNVPFGIVSTDGVGCYEPFFWGSDTPRADLIGRGFRHGVTDCYALVRDYFYQKLGIELNEYPRDWEWWTGGAKLYEDYFEAEGFKRIDESEVREHDCFLAQLRSTTPNHAGVYVGNNLILHHITSRLPVDSSRLSRRDAIGPWAKFICGFWVRHESQFSAT